MVMYLVTLETHVPFEARESILSLTMKKKWLRADGFIISTKEAKLIQFKYIIHLKDALNREKKDQWLKWWNHSESVSWHIYSNVKSIEVPKDSLILTPRGPFNGGFTEAVSLSFCYSTDICWSELRISSKWQKTLGHDSSATDTNYLT